MTDQLDDIRAESLSFVDRARKAVVAAASAGVGSFGVALGALATAGDLDPAKVAAAAGAAVLVALGSLRITYAAQPNKVTPGQGADGTF